MSKKCNFATSILKESDMKKEVKLWSAALFIFMALSLVGCKKESITVSQHELWFPKEASVQDIQLTANCDWTISIDDNADWYSIRNNKDTTQVVSGSGNMTLSVFVNPLQGVLERTSSFTITSAKGKSQVKVRISQNTTEPAEIKDLTNMIFGVSNVAHWNVDYFGNVIEDSYQSFDFDPYDTTRGYFMYFLEDGVGVQQDNVNGQDSTIYWLFTYEYDPVARNLHMEFETISDTISEIYDAPVLSATEELFSFCHEYKPKFWERADMKKVGTFTPQQKSILKRKAKKRDGTGPVFKF